MPRHGLRSTDSTPRRSRMPSQPEATVNSSVDHGSPEPMKKKMKMTASLLSLPPEMILYIGEYLDNKALFALYQTCHYLKNMFDHHDKFWKLICKKEGLARYDCLLSDDTATELTGFSGKPFRIFPDGYMPEHKKMFKRGLHMRKNILTANFRGWRIFANEPLPITHLDGELDVLELKKAMGDFPKLSSNDDIKVDWDDKYLVIFHFFRSNVERSKIWVFDIEEDPKFLYVVEKGTEYVTDKACVYKDHVVMVPSWPLTANALVMTLSIKDKMQVTGKYLFDSQEKQNQIDQLWMHTMLKLVRDSNQAVVACCTPDWECMVIELPSCAPLKMFSMNLIRPDNECLLIRSYIKTAVLIFNVPQTDSTTLVVLTADGPKSKIKASFKCTDAMDVGIFTGDEESIYVLKKNGDIYLFNSNSSKETLIVKNRLLSRITRQNPNPDYQMFVSQNQDLCLLQSASEVETGRYIKVFNSEGQEKYHINLDLWQFGLSRDESLCFFTNGAFLAAANSSKLLLFKLQTGKYLGHLPILNHMERSKGKENNQCTFDPTGLNLLHFDEDRMIAVHDYERAFPSVVDIYKFW